MSLKALDELLEDLLLELMDEYALDDFTPQTKFAKKYAERIEQAIDATLGGGTLTAEQVREAIERNFGKVAVLDDGGPVEWRDDWVCKVGINYRAIADELNTRAERTCYNIAPNPGCFECSVCGCDVSGGDELGANMFNGGWNYCPNCRARVIE